MIRFRAGLLDLLLVALVLYACQARTPVGGLAKRATWYALGWEHQAPALTSYFRVERAWDRVARALEDPTPTPPPPDANALPEPWRSAAFLVLGADALPEIDAAWRGDPEEALAVAALGAAQRERAIARAQATGRTDAERYAVYREFLDDADRRRGDEAVEGVLSTATALHLRWPVEPSWRVSSTYGSRVHPVTGIRQLHNGVDLAVPVGTPVHAAQDGVVLKLAEDDRNGKYVVIDHGNGVRTGYCHLDRFDVEKGQQLSRGESLGLSGNTGRSTGPHLHFLVRVHGRTLDPLPLRRPWTDA